MVDAKTKLRRTMMFVPANSPKMINAADIYGADSIIFDVEDATAVTEKDSARILISEALRVMKFKSEVVVRINHPTQTPYGMDDLACILPSKPNLIRLPKVEHAEEVQLVASEIDRVEKEYGWEKGTINIIGAIESVKGLYNVREICKQDRFVAVALGAEDFIANIKTRRSATGVELYHARSEILMAARDAEIQCFDTVYADIKNLEGFRQEVSLIHDMGFDGKSVVHPSQIKIVNEIFTPTEKEIKHSVKVLKAFDDATKNNKGVISVDGKMIDGPIVVRAERVVAQAKAAGIDVSKYEDVQ